MIDKNNRDVKRTVLVLNCLLIFLIAWSVYRGYTAYQLLAQMLDQHPPTFLSYVLKQNSPALLAATILACGVLLEVFRLRIAILINLGVLLVALGFMLVGEIKIWRHYDGEAQAGLILVGIPLLVICITYGILYRHDFTRLGS